VIVAAIVMVYRYYYL